ncbi:hypothetical protein MIMGU_mgv1a025839mg [Erythranthe guttata]|uniref:MATH domain-containing protein n=1 Tax=Erythranthe guttata TaxID=4155 RepID=A0A022RLU4_ERYGU|nr:hypothetical protein MIMGU_mgv1a025839mg [Erythranthe guttata]
MQTREASPAHFLIKIESVSLLAKCGIDKYETKEFNAGGEYKWKLIIYPNGDDTVGEDGDYVSVNLAMADTISLPRNWEVNVVFNIFIFNQNSGNYLFSGITRRFQTMKSEWGFSKFISKEIMSNPSNGYLVKDNCVFGAEVFVVKSEAVTECLSLNNVNIPYKQEFMISNFSQVEHIWKSQEFSVGGHKWRIWVYPKGDAQETGRDVSVYLSNVSFGPANIRI